jgi:hypothetical protein
MGAGLKSFLHDEVSNTRAYLDDNDFPYYPIPAPCVTSSIKRTSLSKN